MPYPLAAREASKQRSTAATQFDGIVRRLLDVTVAERLASEAEARSGEYIKAYLSTLVALRAEMQTIAAIPDIGTDFPDIAADAGAVIAQTVATIQWIANAIPKATEPPAVAGHLGWETIDLTTGVISPRTFSVAELAGLRAQMTALEATIA